MNYIEFTRYNEWQKRCSVIVDNRFPLDFQLDK